jgi:hypothetical protein
MKIESTKYGGLVITPLTKEEENFLSMLRKILLAYSKKAISLQANHVPPVEQTHSKVS